MKRFALACLAGAATLALPVPAVAQHQVHDMNTMPGMRMPAPKPPPPAKKKGSVKKRAPARKPAAKRPSARRPAAGRPAVPKPVPNPHAGHDMSSMPGMEMPTEPHAQHDMSTMPQSAAPTDAHAGHDMSNMPADSAHAGHDMTATATPAPPVAPPPPEAFSGPEAVGDSIFGAEAMAASRHQLHGEHGKMAVSKLMIDRAEARLGDGPDGYAWDAQFWTGGDIDKLWIKSEGAGQFRGGLEMAEVQALWSHAIGPWFDVQAGIRQDVQPGPNRTHAVLSIQGLAPYRFDVQGAIFLSNKGEVTSRLEGEYDLRLTQKLILQPRVELNLAAQDIPELAIGSGLSTAEAGLRLRYEVTPQFAPYLGVEYERAFGDTGDFRRAAGEKRGGWGLLAGVRLWF